MSWMQDSWDRRYLRRGSRNVANLEAQMAVLWSLATSQQLRVGRLTLPLLILGGSNSQVLTWTTPFASAVYQVSIQRDASIIGAVTTSITSQTAASITVQTTATLAISAGAQLTIIAWTE